MDHKLVSKCKAGTDCVFASIPLIFMFGPSWLAPRLSPALSLSTSGRTHLQDVALFITALSLGAALRTHAKKGLLLGSVVKLDSLLVICPLAY